MQHGKRHKSGSSSLQCLFWTVKQQEAHLRTANQVLQQGVSISAHVSIEFGDSILSMHNLLVNTRVFTDLYMTSALLDLHSRNTHRLVLFYKSLEDRADLFLVQKGMQLIN